MQICKYCFQWRSYTVFVMLTDITDFGKHSQKLHKYYEFRWIDITGFMSSTATDCFYLQSYMWCKVNFIGWLEYELIY